jgi:hypothetical protein
MGPGTGSRATSQTPASQPNPPPPSNEARRTSARTNNKPLSPSEREKARVDAVKEVSTVAEAVAKLESRQFSVPDQEYTNTHLASILFQLTATLPAEGASIVKAVAILVNELDLDSHADRMANSLMDTLAGPMEEYIQMGASIQKHADRVIDGHESIENCVIEMVSRVGNLHDAFRDTQEKADANTLAVQHMIANLKSHLDSPPGPITSPPPPPHAPNSYASRARAQLPAVHNKVMARNEERQRQVLFTKAQGMTSQGLDNQDPQIIVTKANLALNAMKTTHDDIPQNIQFMSAKTLAKGDILFDMDSPESAEWIRKGGIRMEFMQGFGARSEIKDREHSCVVENVPTGFIPSSESILELETINGLTPKSIMLTRWIKPIEHRFEGQRTAFMIFTFRTDEDANKAIHNSLYISGKRCITRKLLPEPRRCYKCHAINAQHIAASCKEISDICNTCGGAHLSKDCQLKNEHPDKHFCINCKTHGHSARDRLCPVYVKHCNDLYNRKPENLYKYFPTDNPDTWELLHPPSPSPLPREDEGYGWSQVTNKKKKQYSFPSPQKQTAPPSPPRHRNAKTTTNSNSIPLGRTGQQRFLDDMGITGSTRPGPSQQYRTPSQRQRADDHRDTQPGPSRSAFSPLSAANPLPSTQDAPHRPQA